MLMMLLSTYKKVNYFSTCLFTRWKKLIQDWEGTDKSQGHFCIKKTHLSFDFLGKQSCQMQAKQNFKSLISFKNKKFGFHYAVPCVHSIPVPQGTINRASPSNSDE